MIIDYLVLALKSLKHRGLRTWLTMLGIFIGIAAVVSLISLGSGLQSAITGQFGGLSIDTLTISNAATAFGPPGSTSVKKLNDHDLDIVKNTDGVKLVVTRLIRIIKFEYNDNTAFIYIADLPEEKEQMDFVYKVANFKSEKGRILNSNDHGKVLLGSDFLTDRFGKTIEPGSKVKINGKDFEVVGISKKTSNFIFNGAIIMLNDDMENLLDIHDNIDLIVAQVEDQNKINDVANEIERKLRKDRNKRIGEEDFSVQTPLESLSAVSTVLNIVNLIVIGIAAISLLVGGIGITNTMYTSTLERTKEIGIMKAVGAKNKDILFIFLIESGLLGLVGGIIGAALGLRLAFAASSVAGSFLGGIDLQVQVSWPLLIGSVAFSFLLGIFSGLLPALQASKLKPVEALRK
ncbi:ABC transporter permease [Candidatus Pacearchaeota archaeon]|nr:ABC transporter permease [Candidatus Pacearchaeota archaeon]